MDIMARITYNKLVRDNIPEILKSKELEFETEIVDDFYTLNKFLKNKLLEEATEYINNNTIEELCDVMEVILKIMSHDCIEPIEILEKMINKRQKRGGFEKNIVLKWVEKN